MCIRDRITAFLQEHWNWVTLIIGVVLLIGAIMNWNWLCDLILHRESLVSPALLLVQFHDQLLVVGQRELREREDHALGTLAADKQLVVELHEQQGGRHQTFTVENADLVRARVINELKVK